MNALPSWLVEATNGTLLVTLLWMMIFDGIYLWHKTAALGGLRAILSEWWRTRSPPAELKAAVALGTLLVGLELRTFVLWWFRHMQNQGVDPSPYKNIGTLLVVFGTVVAVWGAMCWLRVIMPSEFPRSTWFILSGIAVAFGLLMLL